MSSIVSLHPAPRRITRDDIVRAGRGGSPWEFVPLALAALRVMPRDTEIRFLLAAAYATLGLRTPANEQLDRLPAEVADDPNVVALGVAADSPPHDRVSIEELAQTAAMNIQALCQREIEPLDLRSHLDTWREESAALDWFRTHSGDLVSRAAGMVESWERFEPQREMAAALSLDHESSPTATVFAPPYFIEGVDPPWVFLRLCDSTPQRADGYARLIVLAQQDPIQFICGLAHHDLRTHLANPRVRVFVGDDAGVRAREFVLSSARAGLRSAGPVISLPTNESRVEPSLEATVAAAIEVARAESAAVTTRVVSMYPQRDGRAWAERFTAGLARGSTDPLRILITTTRYSTFMKHSAADLAEAFGLLGCRVRLQMEPDDHSLQDPLADLHAIADAAPDLVVVPNYLRSNLGTYPASVPFLTWVQDSMPHLFSEGVGAGLNELDFIAGNLREEMFQSFGYPRVRSLSVPMAASARKFHPGPVAPAAAARHACEIAYVSHHSQTPDALHALRREEGASIPRAPALLDALFPLILDAVSQPISRGPLVSRLSAITIEQMRRHSMPENPSARASILNTYTYPIADRALRHRTLEWTAAIAARRNWRLHLYGKGWETHPTLATHARGELAHGEELRACYQSARVHLHISLHTAIHQRVFECAMSGGLPICRLQADDLSQLEYLAAAHACRAGAEPEEREAERVASLGYRYQAYPTDACDESRRYARFVEAMGLGAPKFAWLNSIHAERLRSSSDEQIDGVGESLWDLWPDPAALMFHNQPTLERVLERAVEDEGWRDEQSRALGDRARERVTYEAFASRVLQFVATGLAGGNENGKTRWYDTPRGRSTGPVKRPITQA